MFVAVFALLCGSCSDFVTPEQSDGTVTFSSRVKMWSSDGEGTEDAPAGTTFRVMICRSGSLNQQKNGTYVYDPSLDVQFLAPARLDDDGTFIEADPDMGADGLTSVSDIFLFSPGVGLQSCGGQDAIVTCPNQVNARGSDAGGIYRAVLEAQDLEKYEVRTFDEPLREMRSRISFEVRSDESLTEQIVVHDIQVYGAGLGTADERLLYLPNTRQCTTPDGIENVMDMGSIDAVSESDGSICFKSGSKYVLSAIYAPKTVAARKLGVAESNGNLLDTDYIKAKINLTQGNRTGETELILNSDAAEEFAEFLPRHEYVFRIVVTSPFLKLYLTVTGLRGNDWQEPDDNHEVDFDAKTVYLGEFAIRGWSDVKYPEQEF